MKLIYNFILIVLMTFVFGQTNCAFSQTQNEIKPEKEFDAKIIPVKNFREKIKLTFPQKENTQTNKEKKDKPKINLIKLKKDKNKSLKVDEKTKKKFSIKEDKIDKKTVNAKVTKNENENENENNAPAKKRSFLRRNKKDSNKKSKKEISNVDITSERMDYDPKTENITASGNARVYFSKEDTTLYANKIIFNHQHNKITAKGKVRMVKNGKWVYGDYIIIDMNFGNSLVENPITKDDKITLSAQYGNMTEDKIKGYWGNVKFNDQTAIALQTRTFGRYFPLEQEFQQDMVDKNDKALKNNSFTLKARTIIIDRFKEHDVAKLKQATIYKNGEHFTGIGDIELITNKDQNYVELSGPEIGSENQLGMFLGYGFVFKMPKGSTLKVAPVVTQKSEFGLGFTSRFLSKRNNVELGYGTSKDKIVLDGKYKINGDWTFDYGINSYKDDGFMGARMPEIIGELRYNKSYKIPELSARFTHELKAGVAKDYNWDDTSDRNFSTFRAKWQAELYKELFTYVYSDDMDVRIGLIGQTSLGVYGTGDTQAVVRFAPTISHRFKRWHSRLSYYMSGIKDDSPFDFDKYRYGKSALEFTQSLALCKYLSIAYRGVYVLDGNTYDNKNMQENRFYVSVGPPNAKFSIGYDYLRKNTYFDMSMLIGSEKSGLDFEYLEMNDIEKQKKNNKFRWFKRLKNKKESQKITL